MAERTVDYFKQKTWCDAKDGLGVWRLGRVKKKQKHKVLVHFDGWSDKWKQWHCIHSNMIAPLRKFSKGYTGQSKVALREWDFNDEYLKIVEGKIKILLHNKFEGFSPYDLAVLLRGDLFVLVDSLLTYTYNVSLGRTRRKTMHECRTSLDLFLSLSSGGCRSPPKPTSRYPPPSSNVSPTSPTPTS